MQDISDANEGLMKMSQIIDAALAEGISETIVRNAISNLHRGGTIYESQTGTYQWT